MTGGRRIPDTVLADLLGRLSTALAAGIDLRRAWAAETARVPGRFRTTMERVGRGLASGNSLGEALRSAGGFPPLVLALAAMGDRTGRQPELVRDAAAALRRAARGRAELARGLVKPALQLLLALAVVGLLILVNGGPEGPDGAAGDMVGLGLRGRRGLAVFAAAVAALAIGVGVLVWLGLRSWAARGSLRGMVRPLPVVGPAVRAAEAAAWSRAASLASGVGLDAGALVDLASEVAPGLAIPSAQIEARLRAGGTLDGALRAAGRLPEEVLRAIAVGELTGTTPETLDREAALLEDRARRGFAAAVEWLGWIAWAGVAALVALVVWRFFAFYAALLENASRL